MAAHGIILIQPTWHLKIDFWDPVNSVSDTLEEYRGTYALGTEADAASDALARIDELTSTGNTYDGWEATGFYLTLTKVYGTTKL